jgi:hypothetical protein
VSQKISTCLAGMKSWVQAPVLPQKKSHESGGLRVQDQTGDLAQVLEHLPSKQVLASTWVQTQVLIKKMNLRPAWVTQWDEREREREKKKEEEEEEKEQAGINH